MKREPAYLIVYQKLKNDIREHVYQVGELLPSESELEQRFGVSRTTIRKAVEMLTRDGYLFVKQGRGTEVLDYSASQNLNVVTSFSETLRKRGFQVRSKSIYIDEISATSFLAKELLIKEGAPVIRIQRLQLADEVPVAVIKNYLPAERFPDFRKRAEYMKSLYMFLEEEYNVNITSAKDKIFAKAADFVDAELLQIAIGSPLLCMARTTNHDNMPLTHDDLHIRYDKYELNLTISGRVKQS